MNNRLTIQDLAGLLAEYTGKDKQSCEQFLREFIDTFKPGIDQENKGNKAENHPGHHTGFDP